MDLWAFTHGLIALKLKIKDIPNTAFHGSAAAAVFCCVAGSSISSWVTGASLGCCKITNCWLQLASSQVWGLMEGHPSLLHVAFIFSSSSRRSELVHVELPGIKERKRCRKILVPSLFFFSFFPTVLKTEHRVLHTKSEHSTTALHL